jgi:ribosomal protein S27E
MAKSEKNDRRTISIHCAKCRSLLYKYRKGGRGGLVKCLVERIAEDFTNGDLHCHSCGQQFARPMSLPGQPVHKIIQGKVYTKGMARK